MCALFGYQRLFTNLSTTRLVLRQQKNHQRLRLLVQPQKLSYCWIRPNKVLANSCLTAKAWNYLCCAYCRMAEQQTLSVQQKSAHFLLGCQLSHIHTFPSNRWSFFLRRKKIMHSCVYKKRAFLVLFVFIFIFQGYIYIYAVLHAY